MMIFLAKVRWLLSILVITVLLSSCNNPNYTEWEPYGDIADFLSIEMDTLEYSKDTSEIKFAITNNSDNRLTTGEPWLLIQRNNKWYHADGGARTLVAWVLPPNSSQESKISTSNLNEKLVKGHYGVAFDVDQGSDGKRYTLIGEFDVK